MKRLLIFASCIIAVILLLTCKKESSKKEILSYTLTGQIGETVIGEGTVAVSVPNSINLSAVTPTVTISDKASIDPASGEDVDFSQGPVTYVVTAEDGSKKNWTVTITPQPRSEAEILTFTVTGQIGVSDVNSSEATVTIAVADTVNLTSIAPEITVSEGATISPASGAVTDFNGGPVTYTVTAEDGTTKKDWAVTVSANLSSEAEILTYGFAMYQAGTTSFEETDIYTQVSYGTNLTILRPIFTLSPNATAVPESNTPTDFTSGSVQYTVTAQDGTQKIWTAHTEYALNYQTNILSYEVPGQIGESSISSPEINVEVDYGTDLSAIMPTIEVSYGATIIPASGETVDFTETGTVEYTVTSENGANVKKWYAHVRYPITAADNPNFQYVGRFDFTNPAQPRVWASGAYIMAKFSGPYCEISLGDEIRYNSNYNYLEIVIDGTQEIRTRTYTTSDVINISDYLTPGDHTLLICKTTESGMGYLDFKGLYLESNAALLTPDPLPSRKIEIIGNSIAVGSNIDISEAPCSDNPNPWFINHNAYFSYGAITARNLDAQYHITAKSGIGLIHSCCDMMYAMPDIFSTTEVELNGHAWDFDQYVPDVVTIGLGQNDGIQDSATFCSAYVDFIGTIRSHYPNATLVLLNSPMGDNTLNTALVKYTQAVTAYMNDQGDNKVYSFELTHNLNSGCGYHPDMAQHELIANELTTFLQSTMGW
jgi:hypothetical protein